MTDRVFSGLFDAWRYGVKPRASEPPKPETDDASPQEATIDDIAAELKRLGAGRIR